MRLVGLLLLVVACSGYGDAQSRPPTDSKVVFEVALATKQREFHIGETIPIQLAFSSAVKDYYQLNMAQYDRIGRMNYEQFTISPANGAVDPLPTYTGSMGGLTNHKFLTEDPWTIKVKLNEWVRFLRPGEYRLVVYSSRVTARNETSFGAAVTARSNEIKLKIIPADLNWQKQTLNSALRILNAAAPTKPPELEQFGISQREAVETLRDLGTAEATRELARHMLRQGSAQMSYVSLALIASPEHEVALNELTRALTDPRQPIDGTLIYTLRVLRSNPADTNADYQKNQTAVVEQLIAALPMKRDEALSVSLGTAVSEAWNSTSLPQETIDSLVKQVVSMFDQLPLNKQSELLSFRWNKIAGPAMLPILRRRALAYQDFPEMRESNAYDALRLSATALGHWYELDPAGARPAIIEEIKRPRPRFDARVLGILPDETLPEVDLALAEHFLAREDLDGSANLASLIARYASDAILSQVLEKLDANVGKWACNIQNPILGYVLRVNPELARPRLQRALEARGNDFTACNQSLFQMVSEIHNDPVLEDLAIKSLDDADPHVAMTAATMLGRFGSKAAQAALWQRYTKWATKWAGHESELVLMFSEAQNENVYQFALGDNLVRALATGTSWLSDKSELEKILRMTTVPRLQQDLERHIKAWDNQPLTISLHNYAPPGGFNAQLAQYEFQSMSELKQKLGQFPSGSKFNLWLESGEGSPTNASIIELRAFLNSHGMTVIEEKRAQ